MLRVCWFFILIGFGSICAQEPRIEKKICLNMIVKNESKAILRCLASVKPLIDYWIIVDTGSSDGTQQMIREFLKEIPGELHERPWVDFGHNRQEALMLAKNKGDYLLFIDADEKLVFVDNEKIDKSTLDQDGYFIVVNDSDPAFPAFQRVLLINNHLRWQWKGVLHEELIPPPEAKNFAHIINVTNMSSSGDGFRSSDPQKYDKDAAVLEKALEKEPDNSRYVFYLAQSYGNAKKYELAIKNYERRASMGGDGKEVFWSLYCAAKLQEHLDKPSELVINAYSKAHQFMPTKAEPLFRLADFFFKKHNYTLGYIISKFALTIQPSSEVCYIENWIYDYGLLFLHANCAFCLGKREIASELYLQLLAKEDLPSDVKNNVRRNLLATKTERIPGQSL